MAVPGEANASAVADRLRDYLRRLPAESQQLLMREYEAALARGSEVAVASFVLGELRKIARREGGANERHRETDVFRLVFAPLAPFLVDARTIRPGQIRRSSIEPIGFWLSRSALARETAALEAALAHGDKSLEAQQAVRDWHAAAAKAIAAALASAHWHEDLRALPPSASDDLEQVGFALQYADTLERFGARLPISFRTLGDIELQALKRVYADYPTLHAPPALAYAMALVMQRLATPWQIIRLAVNMAGSDEEGRISGTPYGVVVTIALFDLAELVGRLQVEIRAGKFDDAAHTLKTLHDALRDFRTDLDLRPDMPWGRQIAAMRADVSRALKHEIEGIPSRVRRLLRQRSSEDLAKGVHFDAIDIDETVALAGFLMTCRTLAGELAINEITLRVASDLQHYVESNTENLIEGLRSGDPRIRALRRQQADIAVRLCEMLFGRDYAALMARAAGLAAGDDSSLDGQSASHGPSASKSDHPERDAATTTASSAA